MNNLYINSFINHCCLYAQWIIIFFNIYLVFYKKKLKGTGYKFLCFFVWLFCMLYIPEEGDVVSYYHLYVSNNQGGHLEPFYEFLIDVIPFGFYYWRSFIWGSAMCIVILSYKKLNIEAGYATIGFLAFSLVQNFYYLRNDLAFSVLIFSLCYFLYYRYYGISKFKRCLFIILGCSSYFFHRSMPLFILLSGVSIYIPYSKKTIFLSLVALPLFFIFFESIATYTLDSDVWMSEGNTTEYALSSLSAQNNYWNRLTLIGKINQIINYIPFVYLYFNSHKILDKDNSEEGSYMKFMIMLSYLISIISIVYMFKGDFLMQIRFLMMSLFPMSFFIPLFVKKYSTRILVRHFFYIIIFYWVILFVLNVK